MRLLISLVSFALSLIGCDPPAGVATLSVSSVEGLEIHFTKTTVAEGSARFECLHSASGRCHYLVLVRDCAAPRADADADCPARTLRRFYLEAGAHLQLDDLPPGAAFCVDQGTLPAVAGCRTAGPPLHARLPAQT
ncbi:MAG TPA: hypothetical protein VK325_06720 [Pseudoxanthomonas sp.]|nr:hypothetical protein [Pseudoxanthomonas sp.]